MPTCAIRPGLEQLNEQVPDALRPSPAKLSKPCEIIPVADAIVEEQGGSARTIMPSAQLQNIAARVISMAASVVARTTSPWAAGIRIDIAGKNLEERSMTPGHQSPGGPAPG